MSGRLKQLLFALCTLFVLIVLPIAPVVSASSQTVPVTVIYGVIPALCVGFKGVAQRLDDISQLGADAIWLSPVNETSAGDFGYAITDHYRVKKALGSTNDLKSLISEAHRRHLKVIFDVALNHLSEEHIFYQDVLKNGSKSEYWDYFQHDKSGQVIYYFDWRNLKNLNFENSSVRSYLIDALKHWVQDFDVDGFRMDAAWAIKERYPQFWPVCLNELRTVKPGLFFLAEASALDPYYVRSGFNAAYDWTEKPGEWAWEEAFSQIFSQRPKKSSDSKPAAVLLKSAIEQNANNASQFRFINNNDTGARFSAKYGQPTTRAAATLLNQLFGSKKVRCPAAPPLCQACSKGFAYWLFPVNTCKFTAAPLGCQDLCPAG